MKYCVRASASPKYHRVNQLLLHSLLQCRRIEDLELVVHWWSSLWRTTRGRHAAWTLIVIELGCLGAKCFALFSHLQVPTILEVLHICLQISEVLY